jgi:hypothetical protein
MKMEQIECSEMSAIINQMPGNHPKEDVLYAISNLLGTGMPAVTKTGLHPKKYNFGANELQWMKDT